MTTYLGGSESNMRETVVSLKVTNSWIQPLEAVMKRKIQFSQIERWLKVLILQQEKKQWVLLTLIWVNLFFLEQTTSNYTGYKTLIILQISANIWNLKMLILSSALMFVFCSQRLLHLKQVIEYQEIRCTELSEREPIVLHLWDLHSNFIKETLWPLIMNTWNSLQLSREAKVSKYLSERVCVAWWWGRTRVKTFQLKTWFIPQTKKRCGKAGIPKKSKLTK